MPSKYPRFIWESKTTRSGRPFWPLPAWVQRRTKTKDCDGKSTCAESFLSYLRRKCICTQCKRTSAGAEPAQRPEKRIRVHRYFYLICSFRDTLYQRPDHGDEQGKNWGDRDSRPGIPSPPKYLYTKTYCIHTKGSPLKYPPEQHSHPGPNWHIALRGLPLPTFKLMP